MNLTSCLEETFATNFVAYFKAHVAHVNVLGRNFNSDHALLDKIYSDLQSNIDVLAEKIRSVKGFMPNSINTVLDLSLLRDINTQGDSEELLKIVLADQEVLIDQYRDLIVSADDVGYADISNYAQDRIAVHAKFRWMLESTLEG